MDKVAEEPIPPLEASESGDGGEIQRKQDRLAIRRSKWNRARQWTNCVFMTQVHFRRQGGRIVGAKSPHLVGYAFLICDHVEENLSVYGIDMRIGLSSR